MYPIDYPGWWTSGVNWWDFAGGSGAGPGENAGGGGGSVDSWPIGTPPPGQGNYEWIIIDPITGRGYWALVPGTGPQIHPNDPPWTPPGASEDPWNQDPSGAGGWATPQPGSGGGSTQPPGEDQGGGGGGVLLPPGTPKPTGPPAPEPPSNIPWWQGIDWTQVAIGSAVAGGMIFLGLDPYGDPILQDPSTGQPTYPEDVTTPPPEPETPIAPPVIPPTVPPEVVPSPIGGGSPGGTPSITMPEIPPVTPWGGPIIPPSGPPTPPVVEWPMPEGGMTTPNYEITKVGSYEPPGYNPVWPVQPVTPQPPTPPPVEAPMPEPQPQQATPETKTQIPDLLTPMAAMAGLGKGAPSVSLPPPAQTVGTPNPIDSLFKLLYPQANQARSLAEIFRGGGY